MEGPPVPQERSRSIQYINKLRILSIYLVVTAHVTIGLTMSSTVFSFHWWLGTAIFYACFCSIPVFVMISGALLLNTSREEPLGEFYRKRMTRVGAPLVIWTVVYLFVRAFVDKEHLTAGRVFELIITADPYYHLWFLYMIVGLYLVTPALRTFVRHATQRERVFVIVLMLILANAYGQADNLLWQNQRSIFTLFVPYIAFYLLGFELGQIDPRKMPPAKYIVLGVLLCVVYLAAFAPAFIARQGGVGPGKRFLFDFFTPPIVLPSIAIFWIARRLEALGSPVAGFRKTAVEWVASATLGVYALHPLVLNRLQHALRHHTSEGSFLLGVLLVPLVTFALCYAITTVLMNIPILRRSVC
jgi:surface polysaccharide O-acyltransferase-like enzyme